MALISWFWFQQTKIRKPPKKKLYVFSPNLLRQQTNKNLPTLISNSKWLWFHGSDFMVQISKIRKAMVLNSRFWFHGSDSFRRRTENTPAWDTRGKRSGGVTWSGESRWVSLSPDRKLTSKSKLKPIVEMNRWAPLSRAIVPKTTLACDTRVAHRSQHLMDRNTYCHQIFSQFSDLPTIDSQKRMGFILYLFAFVQSGMSFENLHDKSELIRIYLSGFFCNYFPAKVKSKSQKRSHSLKGYFPLNMMTLPDERMRSIVLICDFMKENAICKQIHDFIY